MMGKCAENAEYKQDICCKPLNNSNPSHGNLCLLYNCVKKWGTDVLSHKCDKKKEKPGQITHIRQS